MSYGGYEKTVFRVNADDFGRDYASNDGVQMALNHEMLDSASIMAPCSGFAESIAIAKTYSLEVGVHVTLTCEKGYKLKYGPLSKRASLYSVRTPGSMHEYRGWVPKIEGDLKAEVDAQFGAVIDAGLEPGFFDSHVWSIPGKDGRFAWLVDYIIDRYKVPFVDAQKGARHRGRHVIRGVAYPKGKTIDERILSMVSRIRDKDVSWMAVHLNGRNWRDESRFIELCALTSTQAHDAYRERRAHEH